MHSVVQQQTALTVSDSRRELTALAAGCGLYTPSKALFSIAGRDRVRWLNGMVSNNVRDLAPGHGVYAFVLSAQGHILGDLYVFNRGESLTAEIESTQVETLLQIFKRYIIMDKVEIEDLSTTTATIGVTGPKSPDVLASIGLSADLGSLQFAESDWQGFGSTLVRGDNPCVPNFEVWVPTPQAASAREALRQAGAEPVSEDTMETFRILCAIPEFGRDIGERTLPQETGQDRALNFTKGCYIGQEIVERIRARGAVHRAFVAFEVEGNAPAAGTKIQSGAKHVGEITSIMAAPLKGKRLALGYLRKEFMTEDQLLAAGEATVRPVPLPFSDILHPAET
jgi:folate-binding protein YgfZ